VGQQAIQEADHTVAQALHYLHNGVEFAVKMNQPTQLMHCAYKAE
jgi:hypothetical protein